jgi:hypothetical protein
MEIRSYSVFDHRQLLRKKLDPDSFQLMLAEALFEQKKTHIQHKNANFFTICVGTRCTIQMDNSPFWKKGESKGESTYS